MTVRLRFVFALLVVAVMARVWMYEVPYELPPEVIHTRGARSALIFQRPAEPPGDLGTMPLMILTLLQTPSGISIDGQIPAWGVLTFVVLAVAAFAKLQMQVAELTATVKDRIAVHEKADDVRFAEDRAMLREIRDNVMQSAEAIARLDGQVH